MNELLKDLNVIFRQKYPENNIKIKMVISEIGVIYTRDCDQVNLNARIIFNFTLNERMYNYKYAYYNLPFLYKDEVRDSYPRVINQLKKVLLNNLIFAKCDGMMDISGILSGNVEIDSRYLEQ